MANWFDYLKGTANKVKNSALYNALTGNKDEEITFAPLQPKTETPAQGEGANNIPSPLAGEGKGEGLNPQTPYIQGLQLDTDGNIYETDIHPQATKWDKIKSYMGMGNNTDGNNTQRLTLKDRLFGAKEPENNSMEQTGEGSFALTTSDSPRRGGIFPDIGAGFRENKDNGFSTDNWDEKTTPDGRNKGFAYKLGEGLGSIARVAESPLGRGLITAGLVGATGGDGLDMLAYGGQAGMLNQQNRMRDTLYRNDLIENYAQNLLNDPRYNQLSDEEKFAIKNQKYGEEAFTKLSKEEQEKELEKAYNHRILENQQTALDNYRNQIANVRGYMNDDSYTNMIKSQQLRDNAAYRKMYFDAQQEYKAEQAKLEQQRQKEEAARDARDFSLRMAQLQENIRQHNQDLGFKYSQLQSDRDFKNAQLQAKNTPDKNNISKLNDISAVEQQLNNFQSTFKDLPGKLNTYTLGNLAEWTGLQGQQQAQFNAQRTLLFNKIARDLGGEKGVLSDQDIKRIEEALPKWTDSYEQKVAKMSSINDLLNIQKARYGGQATSNDPLGIR